MRKLPKIITKEEFETFFKYVLKKKPKNYRKYLLCMLLGFEAGMRISEIVGWKDKVPSLTERNISFSQNSIRIDSGKGQKDRIVPLPRRIRQSHLRLLPIDLDRRSIQYFIEKHSVNAIGKKISFHTLRHGFGSHLAQEGRPLHEIQMLMGHSRLDTTGIYLHANPKKAIDGAREVF